MRNYDKFVCEDVSVSEDVCVRVSECVYVCVCVLVIDEGDQRLPKMSRGRGINGRL